ncbi:hypothetical protein ABFA07_009487 [Porites harrisoni]
MCTCSNDGPSPSGPITTKTEECICCKEMDRVSPISVLQTIYSTCLGFCWKFQALSIPMLCLQSNKDSFPSEIGQHHGFEDDESLT